MTVKIITTGETQEYNDSYAMRLIEQGKAVPVRPSEKHAEKKGNASSGATRDLPQEGEGK